MATQTADSNAYLLAAGAILPESAKVADAILDVLEARSYTHAALEAPLVRLSPAQVANGIDIAMELLGFDAVGDVRTLGQVRREKLGFPGWALVHDVKNARYALDVLADLKKATRRIKSKPGFAKESIDEIAKTLSGSVPHFLPSFYEEAALSFIEFDNLSYAQQYFEAARRAEREYALEVDDELREQSFVDFALSGALSVKSLSNFAGELASRGAAGLESYLRVCIRRTTGGLPPSPAMLKDLKSLAKAAKQNADDVQVRFLDAILESPALATAAGGFFKEAKKALKLLTKNGPDKRAILLDLFPRSIKTQDWLPVLEECGALEAIVDPEHDGQSQSSAAAWFSRALSRGDSELLHELLVKAKGRLIREGEPIFPVAGWRGVNISVTELAIEHEIPLTFERDDQKLEFSSTIDDWAQATQQDLPFIAGHSEYRPAFIEGCSELSQWDFNRAAANLDARPKYAEMLGEGLTRRLEKLESAALPSCKETLGFLAGMPKEFWGRYPAMQKALAGVDVATSLARSLQIGHFAELVWPKAAALQDDKGFKVTGWFDGGPTAVLYSETRVVVLDANDEVLIDHQAELEPGEKVNRAIWVDGDLCVGFAKGYESAGYYWASAPKERGKSETTYYAPNSGFPLEGGGILVRGHKLRKGDPLRHGNDHVMYDGERYYVWHAGKLHEYDAASGRRGEERWPELLKSDDEARPYRGYVDRVDVPDGAPLRSKDGLIGMRMRPPANGRGQEVEDIAGEAGWTASYGPDAVFLVPGSDTPRILESGYRGLEVWADGIKGIDDDEEYHRNKTAFPSMSLLARYRARDEATSKRLRAITGDQLRALVETASTDTATKAPERSKGWKPDPEVAAELKKVFPELGDQKLETVLLGIAHHAGELEKQRRTIADEAPDAAAAGALYSRRETCDARVGSALGSFAWRFAHIKGEPTLLSEVDELRKRFDAPGPDGFDRVIDWGPHIWQLGLGHGAAALYRYACAPKNADADRTAIESWVRALAAAGFEGEGASRVRISFQRENTQKISKDSWRPTWHVLGDNAIFVWQLGYDPNAWYTFIEHAPSGKFQIATDDKENIAGPGIATDAHIDAVVAHVAANGPLPIDAALPLLCERTGLSPTEAVMWLCVDLEGDAFGRAKNGKAAAAKFWDHDPFVQPFPTHQSRQVRLATRVWTSGGFEALWDPETLAARFADAFLEHHPKLPALGAVDDEAAESLPSSDDKISWLVRAGLDEDAPEKMRPVELFSDRDRHFDENGHQVNGDGFVELDRFIPNMAHALYYAPLASAIVRSLPVLWKTVRERLLHPSYFHSFTSDYFSRNEMPETIKSQLAAFGDDIPKTLWKGKRAKPDPKMPCAMASGDERVIALYAANHYYVSVFAHTSVLLDGGDPRLAIVDAESVAHTTDELAIVFGEVGDGYIALAEELGGREGFGGDPRVSAPKIVANAAKHLGVGEDAAALYLILAALPKPMDRTVRALTGWSTKTLESAAKVLLAKELVLEAKRAGSGRAIFLPGAWLKQGIEEWKNAHLTPMPLDGVLPGDPRSHYTKVFGRIEGGDVPRFEDPPKRKGKKK